MQPWGLCWPCSSPIPLRPGPPVGHLSLAPGGIGLTIKNGEKLGTYSARLSVTDLNAHVTAVTTADIVVEEATLQILQGSFS